jgi:hypothetical protein
VQRPHRGHDHGPTEIGRLPLRALTIAGAAALVAVPLAGAAPPKVIFPLNDPSSVHAGEPPLAGGAVSGEREPQLFKQRVDSREHVRVRVDGSGRPVSVSVVQRLRVTGKGDYLYTVPAPVLGVLPTSDSQSLPGRRTGAILWAGFSPGVRQLGVRARLGLAAAAKYLPLRLSLRVEASGAVLTLHNATSSRVQTASASGDVPTLVRVLDLARRGIYPHGGVGVSIVEPVKPRTAQVEAPLAVRGELSLASGRRRRFSFVLGDGRPLTRVVRLSGHGLPVVQLTAEPVLPRRTLAGGPTVGSRQLLDVAEDAYLRAARVHQYDTYLANPGLGLQSSAADYTYVSAPSATHVLAAEHGGGGGIGTLGLVLIVAGGVVLAGGLVVVWAQV